TAAISSMGTALSAVGAAIATPTVGIFLAAATLCTAIAIGSRYLASHHLHHAQFNSTEIGAQHTAKYLVQEMKKQNACVQEYEQNSRADGRQWAQLVKDQAQSQVAR